jgi:hypothetical protein
MSEQPGPPSSNASDVARIRQELAWAQIALPSDRILLGRLRQAVGGCHDALGVLVQNVVLTERHVAEQALAAALWMPSDEDRAHFHQVLKQDETKALKKFYKEAGLGRHEVAQMIRELDGWASAEARKHFSDGRASR